jgi:hypothetical protein
VSRALDYTANYVNDLFGGLPIHYSPTGPNSNTFAHELVGMLGLGFAKPPNVVGW